MNHDTTGRYRLAAFAAAMIVAACGGSEDAAAPPATTTPPLVVAPSITSQPIAASVSEGQTASFAVTATGTAPITYQWRRNAVDIAGATAATYSLTATLADNGAAFSVSVRNSAGSVASNAALLTVAAPGTLPAITTQPTAAAVTAGGTATFTVAASGAPAPALRWFIVGGADLVDGAGSGALSGATLAGTGSATLTISAVPTSANGLQLAARATNSVGSVTTAPAALAVNGTGQLVAAASGGNVTSGDGRVRLTIPPGALSADALVRIDADAAFSVPAALASQLVGIPSSGYVIVTEGGSLLPDRDLAVAFSFAASALPARIVPLSNPPAAAPPADLLAYDCPDGGEAVAVAFSPGSTNSTELSAVIRGCAAAAATRISRTRLAPTRLPVPADVIWTLFRQTSNDVYSPLAFDHWQQATGVSRTLLLMERQGASVDIQLRIADGAGNLLLERTMPRDTSLARFASSGFFYTARPMTVQQAGGPCSGTQIGSSTEVVGWRMSLRSSGWQVAPAWTRQIPGTNGSATLAGSSCQVSGAVSNAPTRIAVDPSTGGLVLVGQGDSDDPAYAALAPSANAAPGFMLRIAVDGAVSQVQRVHATVQALGARSPLAADAAGNVFIAGSASFLPRLPAAYRANLGTCPFAAASCVVLAKFSPAGGFIWARYVDGHFISDSRSAELGVDRNGNPIYVSASGAGNPTHGLVSTIDGMTGQAVLPALDLGASTFTAPRIDRQNRVVIGVGGSIVTLGTSQVTSVPNAGSVSFFSLDATDRVISAHGTFASAGGTGCTPFPTSPGSCRGWLMQKFTR